MILDKLNPKTKKILSFTLVWVLAGSLGLYLRLYPLYTHSSYATEERAILLVLSNIRGQVISDVQKNHPDLSTRQKNQIIKKNFDEIIRTQNKKFRQSVQKVAREIEASEPGEKTQPYLLASDSYLYYSLTANIVETGKLSDTIKGSKYLNKLMFNPLGHWEPLTAHPFIGYYVYKVMQAFNPDVALMHAVSFTPLTITLLSLVPFLFICASLKCGFLASLVGSIFLLATPIFLKRSMFGWYDNDPYSILFPFTIIAIVLYGLQNRDNRRLSIFYGCCCAFAISLYALFWHGWGFFLAIIIVSALLCLVYDHFFLKEWPQTKNSMIFFSTTCLGTFLGITLLFGINEFFILVKEGWVALSHFVQPHLSLWPDIYIGVGELNRPELDFLITSSGGYIFVMISLAGLILAVIKSWQNPKALDPFKVIVVTILFLSSLFIASGALRFALLCLIPLSILFPYALQSLSQNLDQWIHNNWKITNNKKIITFAVLIAIYSTLLVARVSASYQEIPSLMNKLFNSAWENALVKIRNVSPKNSVVNTWWPPGHFIKAIARRSVAFDGATINYPQGYWIANTLINRNEDEAVGILRMLNNSGNQATEYMQEAGMSLSKAVKTLKLTSRLNEREAYAILKQHLNDDQARHITNLTHKPPPPTYLLIYNELVEKNLQLKFVGHWNFETIEKINSSPDALANLPPRNSQEYIKFLWEVAGGSYKYSGQLSQFSQQGDTLLFEHNIQINLNDKTCRINSKKFGLGIPYSIFYREGDTVIEKKLEDSTLKFSVVLTKDKGVYSCVLLDRRFAQSMLIQLYFFKGKGLKYFDLFANETDLTRRTQIQVYKVNWGKFLADRK